MNEAQRDGRACLRCGGEHGPMVPAGWLDGCQVFQHERCELARATDASAAVACGSVSCLHPATERMLWPGRADWQPVCERCARRARNLAELMGFRLATRAGVTGE